jgi:hypothetical protein
MQVNAKSAAGEQRTVGGFDLDDADFDLGDESDDDVGFTLAEAEYDSDSDTDENNDEQEQEEEYDSDEEFVDEGKWR